MNLDPSWVQVTENIPIIIEELKACARLKDLQKGKTIHEAATLAGVDSNGFVASTLIRMYAKCGSIENAQRAFDRTQKPDVVCWSALILGYAENGEDDKALELFSEMDKEGCPPNERAFLAAVKACHHLASKRHGDCGLRRGRQLHILALHNGFDLDNYVQTCLVDMYAKSGSFKAAKTVFEANRNVVSYNALMLGYADNGQGDEALALLSRMWREGIPPDAVSIMAALKAWTELVVKDEELTKPQCAEKCKAICMLGSCIGVDSDIYVQSTCVHLYAKCGSMQHARFVFDKMRLKHVVSWTALILGYAQNGEGEVSLHMFAEMVRMGYTPTERTFTAALQACTDLASQTKDKQLSRERGWSLHMLGSICGWDMDVFVDSTLVDMYAKCGSMDDARRVFDKIPSKDVVSWCSLMFGYLEMGEAEMALDLFFAMDCLPNGRIFVAVFKACIILVTSVNKLVQTRARQRGSAAHLLASSRKHDSDIYEQSTLVDMYAKFGQMEDARKIFDKMLHHNVVSWNALISGYADNGEPEKALVLFNRMRNEGFTAEGRTFLALFKCCTVFASKELNNRAVQRGKLLHLLAIINGLDSDIYVQCSLVDMYSTFTSMLEARIVFDGMKNKDVASWNAMLIGYTNNGESETSLKLFTQMKSEACEPNGNTFSAVLKASGALGALEFGKQVHEDISKGGFKTDQILTTCLVDFYVKCGSLNEAQRVFDAQSCRDLVAWTALMVGYSRNGDTESLFCLYERMKDAGLQPDKVTFNCILTACSHVGLVEKGRKYFHEMLTKYGVTPDIEHYVCMIDMLGRDKKLEDAMALLRSMPYSTNVVTWMTVMGACQKWRNENLGRLAFESLNYLDNKNPGAYVTIANIYGT